jgi:phosphoribosylaminoimidazolecarboxamide formyltransferase/IMP cyclohydrolase
MTPFRLNEPTPCGKFHEMNKRALFSVYDKRGLLPLAEGVAALGWQLVASGGTARALRGAQLEVVEVSHVTGSPEMLGGRVKTLHPAIHGGILARDNSSDRAELIIHRIEPIAIVVCNLYPFEQTVARAEVTLAEALEQIDIGGVTLLRAAAKNFARVIVLCDPDDYAPVLEQLRTQSEVDSELRLRLAIKAFAHTRAYDTAISSYLQKQLEA